MAANHPSTPILARNLFGNEVTIDVISHAGLIGVHSSDGRDLIMAPAAAYRLAAEMLKAMHGLPPGWLTAGM